MGWNHQLDKQPLQSLIESHRIHLNQIKLCMSGCTHAFWWSQYQELRTSSTFPVTKPSSGWYSTRRCRNSFNPESLLIQHAFLSCMVWPSGWIQQIQLPFWECMAQGFAGPKHGAMARHFETRFSWTSISEELQCVHPSRMWEGFLGRKKSKSKFSRQRGFPGINIQKVWWITALLTMEGTMIWMLLIVVDCCCQCVLSFLRLAMASGTASLPPHAHLLALTGHR